ncbi:ATPase inhibitor mai-2, mitochondrial-like isoform X2 [Tubulanus polymorphus]|uniref:ATPase inhibitor mai-2, mitochondrial-like isoform X2 n=1 Tax=Tubulanus polymorphus TaxID=672921 RepID=UPI003DA454AA
MAELMRRAACSLNISRIVSHHVRLMSSGAGQSGDLGSGAGKGGGKGGSIRDAGGSFGRKGAAQEEEYFRKQHMQQLKALKESLQEEISFHEGHIKHHKESIERHKKRMLKISREEKPKDD